jgi:hypothetical protein
MLFFLKQKSVGGLRICNDPLNLTPARKDRKQSGYWRLSEYTGEDKCSEPRLSEQRVTDSTAD